MWRCWPSLVSLSPSSDPELTAGPLLIPFASGRTLISSASPEQSTLTLLQGQQTLSYSPEDSGGQPGARRDSRVSLETLAPKPQESSWDEGLRNPGPQAQLCAGPFLNEVGLGVRG